uniref:Reverse transcriptase domain-containing protein n=1 Tax=Peronospora matthiolae TaxID=2874970 RepID=A0AAV1T708_9STRA
MNGCGEHNFLVAMLVDQPGASIKSCMSCDAAFTIGNDVDGNTASIALKLGVFQGCPLSPHLFNAAISLLLLALNSLPDTGVKVFSEDRPGAAAYADDLKTFSSTVDGIKRQHAAVQDFLRWTGMKANPHKYSTTSVQLDVRSLHMTSDLRLQLDGTPDPRTQRLQLLPVFGDRGWLRPRAPSR